MARLVKLPSGEVFKEKLTLGQNYYRPKDMFGLEALSKTIDFADKVAKSEGVGALMTAGEKVYDAFSEGDTKTAVDTATAGSDLLQQAAAARVGAKASPMASPTPLFPERVAGAQKRMAAAAGQQGVTPEQTGTTAGLGIQVREDEEQALTPQTPTAVKPPAPAQPAAPQPTAQPTTSPLDMKPQGTQGQVVNVPMGGKDNLFVFDKGAYRPLTAIEQKEFATFGSLGGETPEQQAATERRLAQFAVEQGMAPAPQAAPAPATPAPAPSPAPAAPPARAPMPPSGKGTSVVAQPASPAQGPVSQEPPLRKGQQQPVPASAPEGGPTAPVGEGTGVRAGTTMPQAKQEVLDTIGQGLDFIRNEYARNAERAAATIDLSGYVLGQDMDAVTQAEALNTLMGYAKQLEPKQPDGKPLNIPQKVSVEQLIGFARQAATTAQQQQVLEAFANNQVTGMYAPTIASRLTGDYKKPFLKTILESFPGRSTPAAMHPVDAMYKLAGAAKTYQFGEKTQAEIEAGLPQAMAQRTRAQAEAQAAAAGLSAEKATEVRELLQARRADLLAKANKAIADLTKEKKKGGGGAGKPETIDQKLWIATNIGPIEKRLDTIQQERSKLETRLRELSGKIAEQRGLAGRSLAGVSVRSQLYRDIQEAKAKLAGFEEEAGLARTLLGDLTAEEKDMTAKANELRETAAANIGKRQPRLYTPAEGRGKYHSEQMKKEEAEKEEKKFPAAGQKAETPKGRPTGAEAPRKAAAEKLAGGPKEGDEATANGRAIVFRNGKWVYK